MCERVDIVPYDDTWPERFEAEREVLRAVFAGIDAGIEHVGSTAVPGLGAKPIVDVMVGVSNLAEVETLFAALEREGYRYVQAHEATIPERRYFRKPILGPSAFHLHCVVKGGAFWARQLAFRDYLRAGSLRAIETGAGRAAEPDRVHRGQGTIHRGDTGGRTGRRRAGDARRFRTLTALDAEVNGRSRQASR
jgi:GrpB-like predicted nucleotidyltransferase (UPF0157 family)